MESVEGSGTVLTLVVVEGRTVEEARSDILVLAEERETTYSNIYLLE